MRSADLNIFQRLVRQWDAAHPYNAAQALRIAGEPDLAALRAAWYAAIEALGLGAVHVRGRRYEYVPLNGDAHLYDVSLVPDGVSLAGYISAELNRPFAETGELPLRPFVLRDAAGSFYVGVVYQHWVADSASIREVLREWFVRAYDPPAARARPLGLPRGGYWDLFGPRRARWTIFGQFLNLLRSHLRFRRVRKPRAQGSDDFDMRFALHRVPAGTLDGLRRVARSHGVTINDLFLAVMAEVCERHVPVKDIPRRRDLALGMIVDLRPRSRADFADVFGLFLGFSHVVVSRAALADWPRLVRAISLQTREHKRADAAQASSFWMCAALATGRYVPPAETFRFYRKHMPLSGGISNVNLSATWAAKYHPAPLLEYVRVSPTGPMVPLAFTTTTLGDDLHVGLTYRAAVFPAALAGQLGRAFVDRLVELAAPAEAGLRTED